MNVAFHFSSEGWGGGYGIEIQEFLFTELLQLDLTNAHMLIRLGDLLIWEHMKVVREDPDSVRAMVGVGDKWSTTNFQRLTATLCTDRVFVLVMVGMNSALGRALDLVLKKHPSYLGALELDGTNPRQWVLYNQYLIKRYRLVGKSLRIFFSMGDTENRADWLLEHWSTYPFESVEWEDLGVRFSILDPYESSFEYAHRIAALEGALPKLLDTHLVPVVDQVLVRLGDYDPRLADSLYSAVRALSVAETAEDLAQAALSSRRFLERLADGLYPARNTLRNGRRLDAAAYKNRLWAYIEDNTRTRADVLGELGNRVDDVVNQANKGLHGEFTPHEARGLLVSLIQLTFDLLGLASPPLVASLGPYYREVFNFARKVAEDN